MFVRTQSPDNLAGFKNDRKLTAQHGEHPSTDRHFAPLRAFSMSAGTTASGLTYSVIVLKGSTGLAIGVSSVKLAKVEVLAKKVLRTI